MGYCSQLFTVEFITLKAVQKFVTDVPAMTNGLQWDNLPDVLLVIW